MRVESRHKHEAHTKITAIFTRKHMLIMKEVQQKQQVQSCTSYERSYDCE